MSDPDDAPPGLAAPSRSAAGIAPGHSDPQAEAARQARDVARWRRAVRARLVAERQTLPVAGRREIAEAVSGHLSRLLRARFGSLAGRVIAGYWPIRGEIDLRPLMAEWHAAGARVALPVITEIAAPLVFRRWTPQARLERGHWNIPEPPPGAETLTPEIALAPLVGWALREDAPGGWRLGHGGGYFDRTLAALSPRPFTIGVGLSSARLATIRPQPHDIPLDAIVTEAGIEGGRP